MRKGKLFLLREGSRDLLLNYVMLTGSALERMRGLLWRPSLSEGGALLIDRCGSIHTCGMGYPLDIAFMDRQWVIRKLVTALRPWRMSWCIPAVMTLEMPAGTINRLRLETGMQLSWQESADK